MILDTNSFWSECPNEIMMEQSLSVAALRYVEMEGWFGLDRYIG